MVDGGVGARGVPDDREARTVDLLERARAACDDAAAAPSREAAIELNITLATGIAARYSHRGVDIDDLRQVALLALVLAVDRFDPQRGSPFTPYARITIDGELKRYLRDHAWSVRPPRSLHDLYMEVNRVTQDLTQRLGRSPTAEDVAGLLGITPAQVREAHRVASSYTAASLNALLAEQPDGFVGDGLNLGTVNTVDARLTTLGVGELITALRPRDRLMLQLRFEQDMTQRQIGHILGISQMQVSRLLSGVMTRLRAGLSDGAPHPS